MTHRFRRGSAALAAAVATALLVAGMASAVIPDGGGVYTACKLNATGTLRLIDPSLGTGTLLGYCTKYETQLTWNQKGVPGANGTNGTNGAPGKDGATGKDGAPGTNGTNGVDGAAGPKGDPCLSGDPACVGPKGDRGDPGTNGTNGVDGAAGPKGDPCLSSDRLCIGPKGDQGDKGDPGTNGTNGTNGTTGPQGPIGPTGAPGSGVTTGRIELQAQTLSSGGPVATPTTLLTIPGVGDFTAICTSNGGGGPTKPALGIAFDNTTSATEDLADFTGGISRLVPAGTGHRTGTSLGVIRTWQVSTGFGPTAHVVTFMVSGVVDTPLPGEVQQPCRFQWTALIQ